MQTDISNYVYSLKDSRENPARIFYIGKGTGVRKDDHLTNVDNTSKGKFIKEILASGGKVIVSILSDGLTEPQALKLEAELIIAFGTEKNGGILKNTVSPKGQFKKDRRQLNIPYGIYEKSQYGLRFLKDATTEFIEANPTGIKNSELARYLDLHSDNNGRQKDYLTYSILGTLMRDNIIYKDKDGRYKKK
ncbi:MAG: GIY-YIG nuclease family protein [Bacteroidetes bacterium]|nr:GIY-YIG nuclease family protein [Bacteroidota bacterium]